MLCVWPLSETGFSVDQFKAHDPILQAALNFNRLLHGGIRYLKCGFVSGKNLTRVANTASYQYVDADEDSRKCRGLALET